MHNRLILLLAIEVHAIWEESQSGAMYPPRIKAFLVFR